ncbi:antiterminator Q family protein [Xenorhabdus budapestensis]|uniref:Antitermination protein n=1 Tax=Xenorhabdus budapestensis TaxID=290110 RepID=A0A2D0INA7_XENBU|nr:antiterminator Q family protein [Xenorhabdus budapestensis]PHM23289.1 antitermination protein [Xenorhabdus budapestensis]
MRDNDIHYLLERWGAWAAADNSGVDWSPIAAGFKGLLPSTNKSRPQCTDDEGIMVDGCVARLKKHRPDEYELLILHYVYGVSLRKIAKRRKCSDGTVRKDIQTAMGFIEGAACMITGWN